MNGTFFEKGCLLDQERLPLFGGVQFPFSSIRSHLFTTTIKPQPRSHAALAIRRVLVLQAEMRVDHEQADIGATKGAFGADVGVELHVILHLGLAAETGGVDEANCLAVVDERRIDCVARGWCRMIAVTT